MISITGKYNTAICYTDFIDDKSHKAITDICSKPYTKGCDIRIMPDVHYNGYGGVVGFTMSEPDFIALDLEFSSGCGMHYVKLKQKVIDLNKLDQVCREIPRRTEIWGKPVVDFNFEKLLCYKDLHWKNMLPLTIGTLGSGNHFIELDVDEEGNNYLVIHCTGSGGSYDMLDYYLKRHENNKIIYGEDRLAYLHDMDVFIETSKISRKFICDYICNKLNLDIVEEVDCVHHYFDSKRNIARHGATSAEKGEKIIIPINMKDGCILATGKGNPDWNYSAPHGAGRILSRTAAMNTLTMDEYRTNTANLFSSTISERTLDESPMAYKNIDAITKYIEETATIDKIIKPIFCFKP